MSFMKYLLYLLSLCVCAFALEPADVAVVYNADSELSKKAAERYREVRRIPADNMFPLYGVTRKDISRVEYESIVMSSLLVQARQRGLIWPSGPRNGRKQLKAMVLMPDLPLRVMNDAPQGGRNHTGAALDGELALLGARFPTQGMGFNVLYKKKMPGKNEKQPVMSVCRIDGPDEKSIFRMINDPVQVERSGGLHGWVVVDQGGPYKEGDDMMAAVADCARKHHRPLFYETSKSTLADSFPLMPRTSVYFGWYTNPPNGPFAQKAPSEFRFAKGAIASHLHSFSAVGIRDTSHWVGALLARGACVTAGNVAEPYLSACLDYHFFYERLLAGDCVGEAALLASPTVSWQTIVLGDPLYRPFPKGVTAKGDNPYAQWVEMHKRAAGDLTRLQASVNVKMRAGKDGGVYAEMFAWQCLEEKEFGKAVEYFRVAQAYYKSKSDKIRAQLMMLSALAADGEREDALEGAEQLLRESTGSPYLPAITKTVEALTPRK